MSTLNHYLALLRGVNVGGGNIIRMTDLKTCFEANGLDHVTTYIQSGNVLFTTPEADPEKLAKDLEKSLSRTFKPYNARIILCTQAKLNKIFHQAPKGFGSRPGEYRYDVIFLRAPLTAAEAMKSVETRPGVDEVMAGPDVLYFSRLAARASQTRLTRLISLPIYQYMSIRNWNTTRKLLELMNAHL